MTEQTEEEKKEKSELSSVSEELSKAVSDVRILTKDVNDLKLNIVRLEALLNDYSSQTQQAASDVEENAEKIDGITSDHTIRIHRSGSSMRFEQFHYDAPFDLYHCSATTVKVRGDPNNHAIFVRGIARKILWTGTAILDSVITISASSYIYLKVNLSDSTVTLEKGDTIPDADSTYAYYPLWYLKFRTGTVSQISWKECLDLRWSIYKDFIPDGNYKYEALTWDDAVAGGWAPGWIKAHS